MQSTTAENLSYSRAAGIAFGVGTQLFFAVTVVFLFRFLHDGSTRVSANWFLVDALLALQFAVAHSFVLLPRIRTAISRIVPAQFYGSIFCITTCIGLWLTFTYWRCSSLLVWQCFGLSKVVMRAGFYASWAALILSLSVTGFGYQTGWTQWVYWYRRQPLPRRDFKESGIYRLFRHPGYFSFLGLIWFTPRMTLDHAVLTLVWTAYILIGSYLKDQRLLYYMGDTYREYASRVPGFPGMFFGPLGKWPAPGSTKPVSTPKSITVVPQAA
jgi:protein-S-isoprenylcysteine O-methyltransferase Ste14